MDIHRCRFVQYPLQSINALAFSQSSNLKTKTPLDLRLALGRNNGDVEIWNPQGGLWAQETTLRGSKNTTIEQLAWTQELSLNEEETGNGPRYAPGQLRLFSTGGSTTVTEWDLCTGAPKRRAEGNFGDIWCFAAQPQIQVGKASQSPAPGAESQLLAAGCHDGTIILFSTEDDDLRYVRTLAQPPTKKPKVLSITWRDRNTILAGYEDSTIRVIDVPSRRIIRNMSLGKPADGNNSVVWTVRCLPDGTIVSGDSSGELKVWDAKNYSLVQRLSSHRADVLDIAASASGDTIFSVGVDRRSVTYKQVPLHSNTTKTRWAEVAHRRYHDHDVRCATSFESKDLSVLVSGGMDASPVIVPIRRLQSEYHRVLPYTPQRSQISASKAARLFVAWWDREIVVYRLRKAQSSNAGEMGEPRYETLSRLVLQEDDNIQNARLSPDGHFVVVTTINHIKLFQMRRSGTGLRTRQIELPAAFSRLGGRQVGFSPDGKWVFSVRKDNAIAMVKLILSNDPKQQPTFHQKSVKLYRESRKRPPASLATFSQTITNVTFSDDSRVLAIGDLSGAVDVWLLEGHEDQTFIDEPESESDSGSGSSSSSNASSDDEDDSSSPIIHGQKWIRNPSGSSLPQLESSILVLTFRPTAQSQSPQTHHDNLGLHATRHNHHPVTHELPSSQNIRLIAVTAQHQLIEFDVLSSRLSEWSRRNPSQYLPHDFTKIKDRAIGSFWDNRDAKINGQRLWLYGSSWVFMLDVSRDLPTESVMGRDTLQQNGTSNRKTTEIPATASSTALTTKKHKHRDRNLKRKRNTGAGDEVRPHDRGHGIASEMRRYKHTNGEDAEMIDVNATNGTGNDHEDEMDVDGRDAKEDPLALMRRGEHGANGEGHAAAASTSGPSTRKAFSHWTSFEYHDILGIEVIGPATPSPDSAPSHINGDALTPREGENENVEVIIVERPRYDVEQGPRFDGGQDWDV